MRIGLPKALLYHNFQPAIECLIDEKCMKIVVSASTNKRTLEQGLSLCDEEVCLPVKVLVGHILSLLEDVDTVFLPRVVSLENKRYICPKFLGLPDMVRALLGTKIPFISPTINVGWSRARQIREGYKCLRSYPGNPIKLWGPLIRADRAQQRHRRQLAAMLELPAQGKRVAVLGHAYNVHDEYLNHSILSKLSALGVEAVTVENFCREHIDSGASRLEKDLFWNYGRELVGAALYCLGEEIVDGVILLASFGCGPDSLINEVIERRFSSSPIPLMSIILDEHSSGIGLATRVEAFVDMLNWRERT